MCGMMAVWGACWMKLVSGMEAFSLDSRFGIGLENKGELAEGL